MEVLAIGKFICVPRQNLYWYSMKYPMGVFQAQKHYPLLLNASTILTLVLLILVLVEVVFLVIVQHWIFSLVPLSGWMLCECLQLLNVLFTSFLSRVSFISTNTELIEPVYLPGLTHGFPNFTIDSYQPKSQAHQKQITKFN